MTKTNPPTLRARWLGKTMRELRKEAGLPVNEVVKLLNRHRSTFARFESGELPIPSDELLFMLDIYRVSDIEQRSHILNLAEQVAQRGWWDGFNFGSGLANYVWLESKASAIKIFDATTIPGIAQSADFAQAIIRNGKLQGDEPQIKRALEARAMRSQVLRKSVPPQVQLVLHEPVLSHQVGGPDVLRNQLDHLCDLGSKSHLCIKILPAESWHHIALSVHSNFSLFNLPDEWPDVMAVESPLGFNYRESPDIESFEQAFHSLWNESALNEQESFDCLDSHLKEVTAS